MTFNKFQLCFILDSPKIILGVSPKDLILHELIP